MMQRPKVLLVEDEGNLRFAIRDFLEHSGFDVAEAQSVQVGVATFQTFQPDVTVCDFRLPDGDALLLLKAIQRLEEGAKLVILTAHASVDLAVTAMKEGAENFLTKPVELPVLQLVIERILENERNRRKQRAQQTSAERHMLHPFVGTSAAVQQLRELATKVAQSSSPVLIWGETGSGKGVLARWLHSNGPRRNEPFVDLNCAGLSTHLLESELFGHEKGAFTGAVNAKAGLFEVAHRGTLFLDEIADIDSSVQPKLLKVLEEKQFRRLGEVRSRTSDVRLIAAAHQNLSELVAQQRFRSDLYYRINTLLLHIPPLRSRPEDVPALAESLLAQIRAERGRPELQLSSEALQYLQAYQWPGNIRELKSVLERATLLTEEDVLGRDVLQFEFSPKPVQLDERDLTLAELEARHIQRVLLAESGKVDRAAKRLGVSRSTLYDKLKKLGLDSGN